MSDLDDLLGDPETRECWETVVTGQRPTTMDSIVACYGSPGTARLSSADLARAYGLPFKDAERNFSEAEPTDDQLLAGLNRLLGVTPDAATDEPSRSEPVAEVSTSVSTDFGPPPEELIAVPEDLVRSIERTYAEVSRHGFLTERDFEERLYAWLSRESGA